MSTITEKLKGDQQLTEDETRKSEHYHSRLHDENGPICTPIIATQIEEPKATKPERLSNKYVIKLSENTAAKLKLAININCQKYNNLEFKKKRLKQNKQLMHSTRNNRDSSVQQISTEAATDQPCLNAKNEDFS